MVTILKELLFGIYDDNCTNVSVGKQTRPTRGKLNKR